jgi:hypothetical protein
MEEHRNGSKIICSLKDLVLGGWVREITTKWSTYEKVARDTALQEQSEDR